MDTEKEFTKKSKRIPLLIILAVVMIALVFIYTHVMRNNLRSQTRYAASQNAELIAGKIDSSIGHAKSSIRLTALTASQCMDSEIIEDVNAILDPLLPSTPFAFVEYILADGWNTMNDGGEPFDASDREYYKQGISGKTGIWVNFAPKKSKEVLLNFYTPLEYEGKIVGVFTGTMGGDTAMKPLLQASFLGEEMSGFLCDADGSVISSTISGLEPGSNLQMYLTGELGVSEEFFELLEKQKTENDENVFEFRTKQGKAIGCVSEIEDTGWYVIQVVPAKSLEKIMNSSTIQSILFNMSHDIRTPMNAIIGFADLMEKHIDDRDKVRGYIKKIQDSSDFLLSLINNVLEMSRIESGKMVLSENLWNVEQFNDMLVSVFEEQMKRKNLTFTRSIQIEHEDVICDALKLKEIYLNVLSNALKYTPEGGSISMELTELPYNRDGYGLFRCVITDTGIGMSDEFQKHIFEEFTREASATESGINGSGLGMPIVKKLVEFMDGTIDVQSKVGKGTSVIIAIPHKIADRTAIEEMRNTVSDFTDVSFDGKRILLAEDNDLNAEIAITILEEAGFGVEHAADGVICVDMLEKAEAGYYDLILMDIQMPNMDGYKATQTIRNLSDKEKADITIVAMTANAFEEDKRNAYAAGMNRHIAKPIKVDELMSALKEILG